VKQAGYGLDLKNQVAEIKIKAERKAGELLGETIPQAPPRRAPYRNMDNLAYSFLDSPGSVCRLLSADPVVTKRAHHTVGFPAGVAQVSTRLEYDAVDAVVEFDDKKGAC
jgi:hypothetical protein